jgi:hypothetical protein
MSGNDQPVNGLSTPPGGDEIINRLLRPADRLFSTIRYFSDACLGVSDYSSPVAISYGDVALSLCSSKRLNRRHFGAGLLIPAEETAPAFRAIQCALD